MVSIMDEVHGGHVHGGHVHGGQDWIGSGPCSLLPLLTTSVPNDINVNDRDVAIASFESIIMVKAGVKIRKVVVEGTKVWSGAFGWVPNSNCERVWSDFESDWQYPTLSMSFSSVNVVMLQKLNST